MTCSTRSVIALALLAATTGCHRTPCDDGEMAWIEDGLPFEGDLRGVELFPGSTFHVCASTSLTSTYVYGHGGVITIEGAGVDDTMFDGLGETPGLEVLNPDGDIVVRGLTVRNGGPEPDDADDADAGTYGSTMGTGLYVYGTTALIESVRLAEDSSGALLLDSDTEATLVDSEIKSNPHSGAVLAYSGSTLVSQDTYWGSGDDDNDGHDVSILKSNGDLIAGYDFNGVASFTCSWDEQVCE